MAKGTVLTTAELVTISILQAIKVDLLLEKTKIQKNGAALEEQYIEDEPQQSDFLPSEQLLEGGKVSFEKLIEQMGAEAEDDNQITIEEAIAAVESSCKETSSKPAPAQETHSTTSEKKEASLRVRFNAWLAARGVWRVKKAKLDYDYARTKADVINMCSGLDFAIDLIDHEIERQRHNNGIKIAPVIEGD